MTMIETIARELDQAARYAQPVPQLAQPLTLDQAYEVQRAALARRYGRGDRRVGIKMGFTSRAKRQQMGVDDVIWGRLTAEMLVPEGGSVDLGRFIHPRVEPEIAFLLDHDLDGEASASDVAHAIAGVAPALEIIDSRYRDFRFSLTDVVADNASSSGFVVGGWHSPDTDVSNLGMVLSIDGRAMEIGSSAAIMGHPLRSLVAAARLSHDAGEPLRKGDIVLAGGATAAIALRPGCWVELEVARLGRAGFTCE